MEHSEIENAELRKSLRALEAWVFDGNAHALSYTDLKKLRYGALAAGILRERLPQEIAASAKKKLLQFQARDLAQQQTMQEIGRLFAENQIHFCPIKGADLAPRVYPQGALRPRGDLDVLIQSDDRERALVLLREAGWEQPYRYENPNHEAELFRNGVCLELHFKLPNFPQKAMAKVWQNTIETSPYCHHLDLEFNLLMLFQHSAAHKWHNAFLLLDLAFLVKQEANPDWAKIHAIAREMHLLDPALLFHALNDFFPPEVMPDDEFPPEISAAFRKILLAPATPPRSAQERVLSNVNRFSRQWWISRFQGFRPSVIRWKTGNPRGHYGKLWKDYLIINGGKFFAFLSGLCQLRQGKFPADRLRREIEKKHLKPWL